MASERQENHPDNPWWGEHVQRYELVNGYVSRGARVLDIACGSGFGSHLLALQGYRVTGADLSETTINDCKKEFTHPQLDFLVADATALPFANNSFDAIVSFETLEHTTRYREVLKEFKRVLKPDGVLLLSTPNIVVNSPGGLVTNPYHTQEWNFAQLNELLREEFPRTNLYGQEYQRYKKHRGIRATIAKFLETLMYLRGVRKLPLTVQNAVIKSLIGQGMYPSATDYGLVKERQAIEACKTFFAICQPQ